MEDCNIAEIVFHIGMVALSFIPDFHPKVYVVATQSEMEALFDRQCTTSNKLVHHTVFNFSCP